MNEHDLSTLDRNTHRAWRIGNILTWGLVGMLAAAVTAVIASRFLVAFAAGLIHLPFLFGVLPALALAGTVDGLIVGSKVYRSPALVAVGALVLPGLVAMLRMGYVNFGPAELLILLVPVGITGAFAAVVATLAWRRRPAALRGGPSLQAPVPPMPAGPTS